MCRGRRGFPIRQLSNTTMHFVEGELDSKSDERAFLNKKNMAIVMQFYTYKIQEDLLLNHKEMKLYKAHYVLPGSGNSSFKINFQSEYAFQRRGTCWASWNSQKSVRLGLVWNVLIQKKFVPQCFFQKLIRIRKT